MRSSLWLTLDPPHCRFDANDCSSMEPAALAFYALFGPVDSTPLPSAATDVSTSPLTVWDWHKCCRCTSSRIEIGNGPCECELCVWDLAAFVAAANEFCESFICVNKDARWAVPSFPIARTALTHRSRARLRTQGSGVPARALLPVAGA